MHGVTLAPGIDNRGAIAFTNGKDRFIARSSEIAEGSFGSWHEGRRIGDKGANVAEEETAVRIPDFCFQPGPAVERWAKLEATQGSEELILNLGTCRTDVHNATAR